MKLTTLPTKFLLSSPSKTLWQCRSCIPLFLPVTTTNFHHCWIISFVVYKVTLKRSEMKGHPLLSVMNISYSGLCNADIMYFWCLFVIQHRGLKYFLQFDCNYPYSSGDNKELYLAQLPWPYFSAANCLHVLSRGLFWKSLSVLNKLDFSLKIHISVKSRECLSGQVFFIFILASLLPIYAFCPEAIITPCTCTRMHRLKVTIIWLHWAKSFPKIYVLLLQCSGVPPVSAGETSRCRNRTLASRVEASPQHTKLSLLSELKLAWVQGYIISVPWYPCLSTRTR